MTQQSFPIPPADGVKRQRKPTKRAEAIRAFIVAQVERHPKDLARLVAGEFGISRQGATRHLNALIDQGLLTATGKTRAREYRLRRFVDNAFGVDINPDVQEDRVWLEKFLPSMTDVKENVREICQYGFAEMLNNVVDHSGSEQALVTLIRTATQIQMMVTDNGIGIFNRLQQAFNLYDPRHALLELSKGKLTSDEARHTGEGIFFTSRMFDSYTISSGGLVFIRENDDLGDWLIEVEDATQPAPGTTVTMEISPNADRTIEAVFNAFASEHAEYGFTRTHIPIQLARYEGEQLVSRSQAKRLLARFEQFREVLLDFKGVNTIGQPFADEVFRVFANAHPEVAIIATRATPEINQMIRRVTGGSGSGEKP